MKIIRQVKLQPQVELHPYQEQELFYAQLTVEIVEIQMALAALVALVEAQGLMLYRVVGDLPELVEAMVEMDMVLMTNMVIGMLIRIMEQKDKEVQQRHGDLGHYILVEVVAVRKKVHLFKLLVEAVAVD